MESGRHPRNECVSLVGGPNILSFIRGQLGLWPTDLAGQGAECEKVYSNCARQKD
jgi:hypothetical protein